MQRASPTAAHRESSEGAGAASGAAAGSMEEGAGDGASTLWETRTAEAPSAIQNAFHAVLINRSIVRFL